jgi:hypothetical protein
MYNSDGGPCPHIYTPTIVRVRLELGIRPHRNVLFIFIPLYKPRKSFYILTYGRPVRQAHSTMDVPQCDHQARDERDSPSAKGPTDGLPHDIDSVPRPPKNVFIPSYRMGFLVQQGRERNLPIIMEVTAPFPIAREDGEKSIASPPQKFRLEVPLNNNLAILSGVDEVTFITDSRHVHERMTPTPHVLAHIWSGSCNGSTASYRAGPMASKLATETVSTDVEFTTKELRVVTVETPITGRDGKDRVIQVGTQLDVLAIDDDSGMFVCCLCIVNRDCTILTSCRIVIYQAPTSRPGVRRRSQ